MAPERKQETSGAEWTTCPWCWGSRVIHSADLTRCGPCPCCIGVGEVLRVDDHQEEDDG